MAPGGGAARGGGSGRGLFPGGADPGQLLVGQVGGDAAEVGAELAGVVLDVAEVIEMELAAGEAAVGEAGVGGEGGVGFGGEGGAHLVAAGSEVGEGFGLVEAG